MRFGPPELTPERENEVIDKMAKLIIKNNAELYAVMMLESYLPLADIGSTFSTVFISPLLAIIGGYESMVTEYIVVLGKYENIQKLIRKVEDSMNAKDSKEKKSTNNHTHESYWKKLQKKLRI